MTQDSLGRRGDGARISGSTARHLRPVAVTGAPASARIFGWKMEYTPLMCATDGKNPVCWGGVEEPRPVELPAAVTDVALSSSHGCALLSDGRVACWGDNSSGAVGDLRTGPHSGGCYASRSRRPVSFTAPDHLTPVIVPRLIGVTALAVRRDASCAVDASGRAKCWGEFGWRWDCTQAAQAIAGATGLVRLAAGRRHFCGLRGDGSVVC